MRHGVVTAMSVLAVVLAPATAAWAAFPGRNGQLAVGGDIVNPDGTGRRPFVPGSRVTWSADGMRVAFNTGGGIAVAAADGSDVRVISPDWHDEDPAWSPDGEWIAFSRYVDESQTVEIFTMRADGLDRRQLTSGGADGRISPVWSPDGTTIAFVESARCASWLAAVHPDGSAAQIPGPPTPGALQVLDPDWSPRGDGLTFIDSNHCDHLPGSSVIGPDGALLVGFNPTGCVPPSDTCRWLEHRQPVVSPDGTQVAYSQFGPPGPNGARVIGADGSGDRVLAADDGLLSIDWRPLPVAPAAGLCVRPGARRGGPRSDILVGTPGDDVMCGGAGADVLVGRGGHDILVGGPGADLLLGGLGMDRMFGQAGADKLLGGSGDDILVGGLSRDLLIGGSGADNLLSDNDGAADADFCDPGPDLVLADASDTLRGCPP